MWTLHERRGAHLSKRPAIIIASGTVTLLLLAINLCIGEVALQAVYLMRGGIPSYEGTKPRDGAGTLSRDLDCRASKRHEDVLTKTTRDEIWSHAHRSHTQEEFLPDRESAAVEIKPLRGRRYEKPAVIPIHMFAYNLTRSVDAGFARNLLAR